MMAIAALVVAAVMAQQVPAAPTIQQAFEAAAALDATGTPAARLAAWQALEPRVAKNPRNRALVLTHKSRALLELNRRDEAEAAARDALAGLPTTDVSLRGERFDATLVLALIAETSLDYAAAADHYRAGEALADAAADKLAALYGELKTLTYIEPAQASAVMPRIEALIAANNVAPRVVAWIRRAQAELLLNQGDFANGRLRALESVKLNGGLTTHTDTEDALSRSTAAIAALLDHKPDMAREYLAMSGAGRQQKGSFNSGSGFSAPECGGEAGLKPNDLAVIEFSINDDGSVTDSAPVYAAGGGAVALEFARSAREWFWTPEQVKDIPPFFRYRVRVEMRCVTGFERPSIFPLLDAALGHWLTEKSVPIPPPAIGSDPQVLPTERAQLAAAEAASGASALALIPSLQLIARNAAAPREEANHAARRALAILDANGATGLPRLAVETAAWQSDGSERDFDVIIRHAKDALAVPAYADDPQARTALRIMAASSYRSKPRDALAALTPVAGDTGIARDDPLRVAALVQLASVRYALDDPAGARAAFLDSGLDPKACALVDRPPALVRSAGVFPMEAMQWGFEGFTRIQLDIAADGSTANERVVLAYPAFVFSEAGRKTMDTAKYAKTYRPDGSLGCGGTLTGVRFLLPH